MTVIALGADHAGFPLKEDHRILDVGTDSLGMVIAANKVPGVWAALERVIPRAGVSDAPAH
ncbi:MAG TPA: hypothetical protein VGV13_06540 [Methylomirabilota bacterium]|jgi:ribose 5-phosphate isomerase RpiB|nr:hypothetical protein [Methylomirabilota bacterium]